MMELLEGLGSGLAFGAVGIVLLLVGYGVVDLLTPGNLGQLLFVERNRNVALFVGAGMLAVGGVVTTAIATSANTFVGGLVEATGYGLLGVVLLALAFVLVDALTPGKLGDVVCDPQPHPGVYVAVASQLAVGAIVAAAIA
jgi:uncharacterized membrane protein YjfL (UPF0719 family)